MKTPPLTQTVGSAERAMRALLESRLQQAGLSFPDWTALVFTSSSRLSPEQVSERHLTGHIVSSAEESKTSVDRLVGKRLINVDDNNLLAHSDEGAVLFQKLNTQVREITAALYCDLPQEDLEATHRTLVEIAKRAGNLLKPNSDA